MRVALVAAVLLAACATFPRQQPDFSYVAGCWISQHSIERWSPSPGGGMHATVEWRDRDCIGEQAGFGACQIQIVPDDTGTWRYLYQVTDNQRSYRLTDWTERSATFRAEGHPLRPPLEEWLTLSVQQDRLRIVETVRGVARTRFDGMRCETP